jgi:hypothetical protein
MAAPAFCPLLGPFLIQMSASRFWNERGATEAALLPHAVTVPCVLNLEDDNRHDGRHHDRSGQYSHQSKHFSAGPLEAGRGKPFLNMRSRLLLPGFSSKVVSFLARRFGLRFLSKSLGFVCQPIRKRQGVFETASLHGRCSVPCEVASMPSPNGKGWSKLTTGLNIGTNVSRREV